MSSPYDGEVRRAGVADTDAIASVLGRAFSDNPFIRWIVPDDAHYAAIATDFFRLGVDRDLEQGEVFTTEDHSGAALWLPPGAKSPTIGEQLRMGVSLLKVLGRRTIVGAAALTRFENCRPKTPHWYLTILGTDPTRQGQGIGSKLIAPILERCDADGVPAYLESSNPENVTYYRRFGFEVSGEIPFTRGPTIPLMLREPRGGQA